MEKLIKEIMKDLDCTREEAEEVAAMELKVKENKTDKIPTPPQKRKPTTRKIELDENKVLIIKTIFDNFNLEGVENVNIKNLQKEITFTYKENEYSISLIKHRKK